MCKVGIQNSLGVPSGDDETFAFELGKCLPEDILKVAKATILCFWHKQQVGGSQNNFTYPLGSIHHHTP